MMNVYNVNIMVPPSGDKNDLITITGPPANVEKAKAGLLESVAGFNKEKEDRIAKNQQVSEERGKSLSPPPKKKREWFSGVSLEIFRVDPWVLAVILVPVFMIYGTPIRP